MEKNREIDKIRPKGIHEDILLLREECGCKFFRNEKDFFITSNCPACQTERLNCHFKFNKFGFQHYECSNCQTLFVSPRPSNEALTRFYTQYEAPRLWTKLLTQTSVERKKNQYLPRIQKLLSIIEKNKCQTDFFIDVGAGNGNFAKAVQEMNMFKHVYAQELSPDCIQSCKNNNLEVLQCQIEELDPDSVDCFTANDLIEHLHSPLDFLSVLFSKMKKNGILMFCTPNGQGFDFQIFEDKTVNITPPEHLQYFNPKSAQILLEKSGFKMVEVSTPGILDVEIVKRELSKNLTSFPNNKYINFLLSLENSELEASLQKFLSDQKLSSHMLVFAQKI